MMPRPQREPTGVSAYQRLKDEGLAETMRAAEERELQEQAKAIYEEQGSLPGFVALAELSADLMIGLDKNSRPLQTPYGEVVMVRMGSKVHGYYTAMLYHDGSEA